MEPVILVLSDETDWAAFLRGEADARVVCEAAGPAAPVFAGEWPPEPVDLAALDPGEYGIEAGSPPAPARPLPGAFPRRVPAAPWRAGAMLARKARCARAREAVLTR